MTYPQGPWGPSEYPQQGYRQNYPQGQPGQPAQFDPWAASQPPPASAPPRGQQGPSPQDQFNRYHQPQYRQPVPAPQFQPQSQHYTQPAPAPRHPVARPRTTAAPGRLPPYPAHLVRFPSKSLPRARRRRGHSIGWYVYMGTHPVAVLISLYINLMVVCVIVCWLVLVVEVWLIWVVLVTMAWLVQVAAASLRMAFAVKREG